MIPLSLILIATGLLALLFGFRGRVVPTHGPRCPNPRCFYPLGASLERRADTDEGAEYGYPIVCPECGRMTGSPVEARWSYRKFGMRRVYLGLALLVIGAPLLIGASALNNPSPLILRNLPTPILLHLATKGDHYTPRAELLRRVDAGEYTGAAAERIAERLLEVQAKPFFARGPLAESLYILVDTNALKPELVGRAHEGIWSFQIDAPQTVTPGAIIPLEVIAHYRGPSSRYRATALKFLHMSDMIFTLDRVVIGNREVDLSDRQPVVTPLSSTIMGHTGGVRFSLDDTDPWVKEAFAAPDTHGDLTIKIHAHWNVGVGTGPSRVIHFHGSLREACAVTVTSTSQPAAPAP